MQLGLGKQNFMSFLMAERSIAFGSVGDGLFVCLRYCDY
jgi:hypothetical protein